MKLVSGTTYSLPYLEALVTPSPSLLGKVSLDIQTESVPLSGHLTVFIL